MNEVIGGDSNEIKSCWSPLPLKVEGVFRMGKVALITGASGGIGRAIAMKLAQEGYTLYLHYFQGEKAIHQLMIDIQQLGVTAYPVQADLADEAGPFQLIMQIKQPIDVIVHNSGTSFYALMTDMTEEQIKQMIQLHVTSPFIVTQKLLPQMIKKQSGRILFITSIWGLTGASCEVLYSLVKGGQNSFTKALAKEVAPSGITVNAIAPGAVDTNMMSGFTEGEQAELKEEIPMGRFADPSEIADAVSFLLSERAGYISGQILSVNGAWYC